MTQENSTYPRVTEIMKISDTVEGNGVYELEIKIQLGAESEPVAETIISRPDDPYGVNPQIRLWMSENPEAPVHAYVPPVALTPEEARALMPNLSARQLRLGLLSSGITPTNVAAVINGMPDSPEKEAALIEWEYATEFRRTHALLVQVGAALGLTETQIDTMWTASIAR